MVACELGGFYVSQLNPGLDAEHRSVRFWRRQSLEPEKFQIGRALFFSCLESRAHIGFRLVSGGCRVHDLDDRSHRCAHRLLGFAYLMAVQAGVKRDFGGLKPGQSARHSPSRANEMEAMVQGPIEFVPGSRGKELGTAPKGVRMAAIARLTKR